MSNVSNEAPDYGNWVSMRLLYRFAVGAIIFVALSFVFFAAIIGVVVCVVTLGYFALARVLMSARGGNLQARVRGLVLERLAWDGEGRALDIGCGNGPLAIDVAKKYPNSLVRGIDNWDGKWAYSQSVCEHNAEIEGVVDRVTFQRASASALPFDDESFDAAVSNLVFHEVGGVHDKRDLVKEALRVVKKGGSFAFQDLFLLRKAYGDVDELLATIRSWGIERVEFADTSRSSFIPRVLRPSFMLGAIGIVYGRK
ncbi:MAG: class I SAM-dependent methyltransferase [Halobacteriota archaeon]